MSIHRLVLQLVVAGGTEDALRRRAAHHRREEFEFFSPANVDREEDGHLGV